MSPLRRIALAAVLVLTAGLGADAAAVPDQAALPRGTVAKVGDEPISDRRFQHWFRISLRGERRAPRPGSPGYRRLRRQVMEFLLQASWIEQEARERGVSVSRRAVRRKFRRRKRQEFRSEREYRRFLRKSGMKTRDILYRVRLDTLQESLTRRVTRGIRSPTAQQRALDRFIREFRAKWKARTSCAIGYRVDECSAEVPVA